jgi:transcriptional regulator with XRE-family HTH domain
LLLLSGKYFIITVMNEVTLKNNVLPRLGELLKVYREKTGHNQSEVSSRAHISISMLSQIERGVVSPSIDTLMMVCEALGMDPSELFKRLSLKAPVRIHHPQERLRMSSGGVKYEQLITSADSAYPSELFMLEVKPGCGTTLSNQGHEGVEMGFVMTGKANLTVDGVDYPVQEGDSMSFNSHLPHRLQNTGKALFRAVWSTSPPHVDYLKMNDKEVTNGKNHYGKNF